MSSDVTGTLDMFDLVRNDSSCWSSVSIFPVAVLPLDTVEDLPAVFANVAVGKIQMVGLQQLGLQRYEFFR